MIFWRKGGENFGLTDCVGDGKDPRTSRLADLGWQISTEEGNLIRVELGQTLPTTQQGDQKVLAQKFGSSKLPRIWEIQPPRCNASWDRGSDVRTLFKVNNGEKQEVNYLGKNCFEG